MNRGISAHAHPNAASRHHLRSRFFDRRTRRLRPEQSTARRQRDLFPDISFAIREDPAYIELSDISLVDLTAGSGNLLTNGDFSGSTYSSAGGLPQPDGWNYLNIYNATASGRVLGDCGFTANGNCYYDGSVGSYDAIDQAVATTIGDAYQISFYYLDTDANSIYAPQGDGTGRDMFVYAGDAPTAAVPEPASIAIFAAGLLGLAAVQRRRML
jgi:hypothetical protein